MWLGISDRMTKRLLLSLNSSLSTTRIVANLFIHFNDKVLIIVRLLISLRFKKWNHRLMRKQMQSWVYCLYSLWSFNWSHWLCGNSWILSQYRSSSLHNCCGLSSGSWATLQLDADCHTYVLNIECISHSVKVSFWS